MKISIFKIKILLARWILKVPFIPVYLVFCIDLLAVIFSMVLSFLFLKSVDQEYFKIYDSLSWSFLMFFSLAGMMLWKRTFRGIVRFTDILEIINYILVFTLSIVLFLVFELVVFLFGLAVNFPSSYILLVHISSFVSILLFKIIIKESFSKIQLKKYKTNKVLIFGAGHSGMMVFHLLRRELNSVDKIFGFFDDDPTKRGKLLLGKKIYFGETILEPLLLEKDITELIVGVRKITNKRKKELFDICYRNKIKLKFLPSFNWVGQEALEVKDLRNINLEELLGRDPIELDQKHLLNNFEGKVVLVTGAGGSIGSELCRQISCYGVSKLILLDMAESALYDILQELNRKNLSFCIEPVLADIKNKKLVQEIFDKYRPNFVFHAAAYKHVPLMESYPKLAIETNILGSQNVADAAVLFGAEKFILISTDKAVNPTNVMGATKRMAELYTQSRFYSSSFPTTTQFITTRFGNVLGSNGSVIPLFLNQIESGGPVTVTHKDIERYFMTIPEASKLVMEAGSMGQGGEIYVFDMGESVKIYDLAEKMISLSGKVVNKDIFIELTGLRSGEKLFEELVGIREKFKPTHHPKIYIVQSFPYDYSKILSVLERLQVGLSDGIAEEELIVLIKSVIPEFKSSYSRFAILDN